MTMGAPAEQRSRGAPMYIASKRTGGGMKLLLIGMVAILAAGCGHQRLDYAAQAPAGMKWPEAAAIVEQGFYEDFGKRKAEAAMVGEDFITLSDGTISTGQGFATAAPLGAGAIAAGSSTVTTREAGQRLYYRSMGRPSVFKRRMKERYAVMIRSNEGANLRVVLFRSLPRAEEFANALEYLRTNH